MLVRGPSLFEGYLGQPRRDRRRATATAGSSTGDLGTLAPDGYLRLVGRRSTDLIKSGGYRIGAGEIEGALLEHPAVAEAAVLGVPDEDLGERIVAWVVTREAAAVGEQELIDHVAALAHAAQAPAGGALRRCAAAQRAGQGPEAPAGSHRRGSPPERLRPAICGIGGASAFRARVGRPC